MNRVEQRDWVPGIGHNLHLETTTMQVIKDKLRTRCALVHDPTWNAELLMSQHAATEAATEKTNYLCRNCLPDKDTETSSRCCPALKLPYSLMYSSRDIVTKNLWGYGFLPSAF